MAATTSERRRRRSRRTAWQWGVRSGLAFFAAIIGLACVSLTLGQVTMRRNPETSYHLAPVNGKVTAHLAAALSGAGASPANRARADTLARAALRREATAVEAVSTLGLNSALRGDEARARRLFAYAQKLSRRDLQTQLWAIEQAVARGDISNALQHYDIALRTHLTSWDLLFPVLAAATTEPAVRVGLIRTLATGPSWGHPFIVYVADHNPGPRSTAALFDGLGRAGIVVPEGARARVVDTLIDRGAIDEAWRFYAAGKPGALRTISRDERFSGSGDAPSMLDWVPMNDGSITTSIQRDDQGNVFDFAAPASVGGPLLRQVQLLPPGSYRISGISRGIEQVSTASPYWALSCREDGRELGRVTMPNSAQAGGRFEGRVVVPVGCAVQVLTLVARPSDAVAGVSGRINRVRLAPLR